MFRVAAVSVRSRKTSRRAALSGCLIALKARAWLDLSGRKAAGEANVADVDIKKHRNDVFSGLLGQFSIGNTPDLEYANHHA